MTWNIKARQRKITALEKGFHPKDPGGRLKVALIWPGTYRVGMSALGYLSIYGWLNRQPDLLAERFFWPDGELAREYGRTGDPLLSLDSGRPLAEFDLVAASLSLENDYWLLPRILERAGLPPLAADRSPDDPPVLVGGVAVWANSWPLGPFVDLVLAGEAEAQWPRLVSAWRAIGFSPLPKADLLRLIRRNTPGALHPGVVTEPLAPPGEGLRDLNFFSEPARPAILAWPPAPGAGAPPVELFRARDLAPPVSPIITPQAEFADTRLVEISRGCPYGCRFCLAGVLFRPHRPWPLAGILEALGPPELPGEKVGLISPAAADHPDLAELLAALFEQNRIVTLSSLRLSAVTPALAEKLADGRLYGAAVAPEGGSQSLRDRLNKDLSETVILEGARLLAEAGLRKIKLYFMIGLPCETEDDLAALIDLVGKIRAVARRGAARPELLVSLANFTPKAHTPFEDAPMDTPAELKRKGRLISQGLRGQARLSVNFDPPLWSIAQGLLARGGPESWRLVEALARHEGRLKPSLADYGYGPDHPLHRPWPEDRPRPWRLIEPAVGFPYLATEKNRARQNFLTPPCPPTPCHRCSACQG